MIIALEESRLLMSSSKLSHRTGCDWEITAYFRALPDVTNQEQRLWIPTDTKLWQHPPLITPIKSMSSNPLKLQLYLEHPDPSEPEDHTTPEASQMPSDFVRGC